MLKTFPAGNLELRHSKLSDNAVYISNHAVEEYGVINAAFRALATDTAELVFARRGVKKTTC